MSTLTRIIRLNTFRSVFYNAFRTTSTHSDINPVVTRLSNINPWIWQQKQTNLQLPEVTKINTVLPSGMIWNPHVNENINKIIDEPVDTTIDNTKQAARLIVIRRKKMKKHKLKKLRKRVKFERAKLRQKRELRKEKEFQAGLIQQCKTADTFSAEEYVNKKLTNYYMVVVPKRWKGRRMPEYMIREKMGLPPKK
ncbi:hypothetical protein Trydic_g17983 [Trypoxylus dichotomus]